MGRLNDHFRHRAECPLLAHCGPQSHRPRWGI